MTASPVPTEGDNWYVVHTHPNAEPRALAHVLHQGFEAYLPRYLKRRSHARRTDWVRAPLFPRYLFVRMNPDVSRWRALHSTVGVSHLVCHGDRPTPIPDPIVDDIRRHEDAKGNVVIGARAALNKGDRVRITEGAMADHVGVFDVPSDTDRVFLLLELLGRQVRVRVPLSAVTPAAS